MPLKHVPWLLPRLSHFSVLDQPQVFPSGHHWLVHTKLLLVQTLWVVWMVARNQLSLDFPVSYENLGLLAPAVLPRIQISIVEGCVYIVFILNELPR